LQQYLPEILLSPPRPDELEISLFGPGRGECVVAHLGNNKWLIVDSCLAKGNSEPVALQYFNRLNIDPYDAVKRIIISHWHDDHIKGISTIVKHCPAAYVYFPQALQQEEFFTLLTSFHSIDSRAGSVPVNLADFVRAEDLTSGLSEIARIVSHAYQQESVHRYKRKIKYADDSTIIYEDRGNSPRVGVRSLSPSGKMVNNALLYFAGLIPPSTQRGVIPYPEKNDASIAIWIEFNNIFVLLGGDLEDSTDHDLGWLAVLHGPNPPQGGKASIFKVPHHGSANGHNDQVWRHQLLPQVHAILTPFYGSSNPPPTHSDLKRMIALTEHVSFTAPPRIPKKKYDDHVVRKMLSGTVTERRTLVGQMGHIQIRTRDGERFTVGYDGPAALVTSDFLKEYEWLSR